MGPDRRDEIEGENAGDGPDESGYSGISSSKASEAMSSIVAPLVTNAGHGALTGNETEASEAKETTGATDSSSDISTSKLLSEVLEATSGGEEIVRTRRPKLLPDPREVMESLDEEDEDDAREGRPVIGRFGADFGRLRGETELSTISSVSPRSIPTLSPPSFRNNEESGSGSASDHYKDSSQSGSAGRGGGSSKGSAKDETRSEGTEGTPTRSPRGSANERSRSDETGDSLPRSPARGHDSASTGLEKEESESRSKETSDSQLQSGGRGSAMYSSEFEDEGLRSEGASTSSAGPLLSDRLFINR
ncbi:hypothetical protein HK101_009674 [Irineochytrium annulatum]|nr:hypothetical protein HK101_009674 [Irineochytrium annulatum]